MNLYVAILVVVFLKPLFADDSVKKSTKESLASALVFFNKDNCKSALKELSGIDVSTAFDNSDDMKLALKIRVTCSSELGDEKTAQESIQELYSIDPQYRFNAFDTPASVIELANKEVQKIEAKNKELALLTKKDSPSKTAAKTIVISPPQKPKIGTALFPFGINHYLMNAPLKGSIYLSLQSLGLLANIGAFWWKQSYLHSFGSSRLLNAQEKNAFNTAQNIQYIALGTFITALGVSIIDALLQMPKSS